tara:strand:- start:1197 stop:1874 length:678 start_codon:yes stop_codon:yes gene_type:complete
MKVAIIPAREKSKRIKYKNIKKFLGTPIIEITFKKLKSFKIFDKIILDTESEKIIKATSHLNFDLIIKRPKFLSNDKKSTYQVMDHAIKILKKDFKNITNLTCVYPCNPFLKKKLFVKAFKKLKKKNDFAFVVQEFPSPIERSIIKKKNSFIFANKNNIKKRSQEFKKSYYDCGQFYTASVSAWRSNNKNFKCIVVPKFSTIDINDISDWSFSEKIFKLLINEKK